MNGVTGRMGYRQHLVRSILAIRDRAACRSATAAWSGPSRSWSAAARPSSRDIADRHGIEDWTTDLDAALAASGRRRDLLRRPGHLGPRYPAVMKAIAAGKHIYSEKPTAEPPRAGALDLARLGRRAPASSTAWCRTSCSCPACASCKRLIDGGFFGRILSVRGEFGYWVFEGDWQNAQRPSLELPRGGRRRHRARHVPALEVRAGGALRPGRGGHRASGHAHPASAGTSTASPTTPPPTTPRTAIFELDGGVVAQINSSWAVRVNRDELVEFQVDGTARQRRRRAAQLPRPAPRRHPEAGLEPGPAGHRARSATSGRWSRTTTSSTTASRRSGSCSSGTSCATSRSRRTCSPAPAACSSPSWACSRPREGRRIEVPGATVAGRMTGRSARGRRDPQRTSSRAAPAAGRAREAPPPRRGSCSRPPTWSPTRCADARRRRRPRVDWDATLAFRRHLWSHGLRRRRGDGHRAARHGPGLGRRPRADPPQRRGGADVGDPAELIACGVGTDQLARRADSPGRGRRRRTASSSHVVEAAGARADPDGQPAAGRGRARARGLPARSTGTCSARRPAR